MTTNITDYVANIIAGREIISRLYCAVDNARYGVNDSRNFCYQVVIPGIGRKMYNAICLTKLDTKAFCTSLDTIVNMLNNPMTVDDYVMLLLKGRKEIMQLYQARYKALYTRQNNKNFQLIFTQPYGQYANVNRYTTTFNNANGYLLFFCESQKLKFNPRLLFPLLFQ